MDMVLVLGVVTGMRSMTAIAALCWAAWLGLIPEHGWALWISYLAAAIVFTICALGEYVVDTLPKTPRRTDLGPALLRVVIGSLVGALVATAINEPIAGGVIFGAVGAIIGTWGGFFVRMTVARMFKRDLPAALLETASAIALAVIAIARLHHGIVIEMQKAAS
ncbi:MAG TPA: DUF4126 domain-containing protein [Acidobacteriaceae bacterium]|jgi:uncharacterized membrane protein